MQYVHVPEQFTAIGVVLVVDRFLQNSTEMKRQPAQSKNQHQAENRLGYFPTLQHPQTKTNREFLRTLAVRGYVVILHAYLFHVVVEGDAHSFLATEHFTGHECVEDSRAGQREAEIESKEPPVLHILVELRDKEWQKNYFLTEQDLFQTLTTSFVVFSAQQ